MRFLKVFIVAVFSMFLACSSDEDSSSSNTSELNYEENILGKWIVEYQWEGTPRGNYEDYIGLPESDPDWTTPFPDISDPDATTHLFRSDGTVLIQEWGYPGRTLEYYLEGNQLFTDNFRDSPPEVEWHTQRIFHMTSNSFIMSKTCYNNICDDGNIEVRYYSRVE